MSPVDTEYMINASGLQKPNDCRWRRAKQHRGMADHLHLTGEPGAEFDSPANLPGRGKIANRHAEQQRLEQKNRRAIATEPWQLPRALLPRLQSPPAAPTNHCALLLVDSARAKGGWAAQRQSICESFLFSRAARRRHSPRQHSRLPLDCQGLAYSLRPERPHPLPQTLSKNFRRR